MFGFFRKKSPAQKLQRQYEKLMSEAHTLSQVNRAAGDSKYAEAQEILEKIETLGSSA
ncbi:MAG: Lacal_2735 family protein [Robiginitalea sp.]